MKKTHIVLLMLLSVTLISGCSIYNAADETAASVQSVTADKVEVETDLVAKVTKKPSTVVPQTKVAKPATASIEISNFAFSPKTLNISTNTTVKWINKDKAPHTIVAQNGTFTSKTLNTGGSFSFTFKSKGTYVYSCGIHPSMKGTVIVK